MSEQTFLTNQFLVAMPSLIDPNFYHTVTYICEHNEQGAMGIIINRPLDIYLGEILKQMNIPSENPNINQLPIMAGGPVGTEQGFILHEPHQTWKSTLLTSDSIAITTSRDILHAIATGLGPKRSLISLGYAGWGAGQLEQELKKNYWLNVPANIEIIFEKPFNERWMAATKSLGIDLFNLSSEIGHG